MPSILNEYVTRKMSAMDLRGELRRLISAYNAHTGRYLLVYAADITKGSASIDVSLAQDDFFTIQDILRDSTRDVIDVYIETPGGSGESAEEIAKFLHKKFKEVNFVIVGEAKSAGTILALSGDNIYMADTGSLGPIDAQMRIGRSQVSAHDYKVWVDEVRNNAALTGYINPADAIMMAQISPGELAGVNNALEFAKDLVKEWLTKYKFKNWHKTRTNGHTVTDEKRAERASEVAERLCNHTAWRTHGRSLKIEDLQDVLEIESIDADPTLADIAYRIKTVIRLLFSSSNIFKHFALEDFEMAKTATNASQPVASAPSLVPAPAPTHEPTLQDLANTEIAEADIDIVCSNCSKQHTVRAFTEKANDQQREQARQINRLINENDTLMCDNCNFATDLKPVMNMLENDLRKKFHFK